MGRGLTGRDGVPAGNELLIRIADNPAAMAATGSLLPDR